MSYTHAIVWLDHLNATVIGFSRDSHETTRFHSLTPNRQLHRKSGMPGSGHASDDVEFFDRLAAALDDVREVLVTGPGTAKVTFMRHVEKRHPELAHRVVATETLDHPSDGELLAYGRKYFIRVDQLGNY